MVDSTHPNVAYDTNVDEKPYRAKRKKIANGLASRIPHVYLASPYAHYDPDVMRARYEAALDAAGILMSQAVPVYSPIVHNHPIAAETDLPRDWGFWSKMNLPILQVCSALYVLQLDGWEQSIGVTAEIKYAEEIGIPVRYVRYGPNDGTGDGLTLDGPLPISELDRK